MRSFRVAIAAVVLVGVVGLVGCGDDPLASSCTVDADCSGDGALLCHTAVGSGVCAPSCGLQKDDVAKELYCRTTMGVDPQDAEGGLEALTWTCSGRGTCYILDACTKDSECEDGKTCQMGSTGKRDGTHLCLGNCNDPGAEPCPAGTVCGSDGTCQKGCEDDPTLCAPGELCQKAFSAVAKCTAPCQEGGIDCASSPGFYCDSTTGLCTPGCENDMSCTMPNTVCHNAGLPGSACFAPCPMTSCDFFENTMCVDGHCVAM